MLQQDIYETLKKVKNECNQINDKTKSYKFFKNEKYQEYKLDLQKLSHSRYIEITKNFYKEYELWIIKVKPKDHVYLKCCESLLPYQKKLEWQNRLD